MAEPITLEQIKTLSTRDLLAIVRTTNPRGRLWLEYMTALDELRRRKITWHVRAA